MSSPRAFVFLTIAVGVAACQTLLDFAPRADRGSGDAQRTDEAAVVNDAQPAPVDAVALEASTQDATALACEKQDPTLLACDDFDDSAPWAWNVIALPAANLGTLDRQPTDFVSPPASLLARLSAVPDAQTTQLALRRDVMATRLDVSYAFDVKVNACPANTEFFRLALNATGSQHVAIGCDSAGKAEIWFRGDTEVQPLLVGTVNMPVATWISFSGSIAGTTFYSRIIDRASANILATSTTGILAEYAATNARPTWVMLGFTQVKSPNPELVFRFDDFTLRSP